MNIPANFDEYVIFILFTVDKDMIDLSAIVFSAPYSCKVTSL